MFRSTACSLLPDGLSLIECQAKRVHPVEGRDLVEMFTNPPRGQEDASCPYQLVATGVEDIVG